MRNVLLFFVLFFSLMTKGVAIASEDLTPKEVETGYKLLKEKGITQKQIKEILSEKQKKSVQKEDSFEDEEFPQKTSLSFPKKRATAETDYFKKYFLEKKAGRKMESLSLVRFGEEFFLKRVPITSLRYVPPPDYILGPGDEIVLYLWGRISETYNLEINREGYIKLPEVGMFKIGGLTYKEAKEIIKSKYGSITGVKSALTLGKPRSIRIFIVGEVRKPGSYLLPYFSTITDALMVAGGPTERGSFRKIELRRNAHIYRFDFYDLLIAGRKEGDRRLENGDIVFVPLAGPLVAVNGAVRRPGIYELKEKENALENLLLLAGGILPSGSTLVQIERFENHTWKKVREFELNERTRGFKLHDGDIVKLFDITEKDLKAVFLLGNVETPGKREWRPGITVNELVKKEELLDDTFLDYALIKRTDEVTLETRLIPFSLRKILAGEIRIPLQPGDRVYIFKSTANEVYIGGEVRNPGNYIIESDAKIRDLMYRAGGLTLNASRRYSELLRVENGTYRRFIFSPERALKGDEKHNLKLQPGDRIRIYSLEDELTKYFVEVTGEVKNPGRYLYSANMTIKDLLVVAGGLQPGAYLEEAEIMRLRCKEKECTYALIPINLREVLEGKKRVDLEPFDVLHVKSLYAFAKGWTVTVRGEVLFPGSYLVKQGDRLSDLLRRAGGYTERAFLKGAILKRKRIKELQKKHLARIIKELEVKIIEAEMALSSREEAMAVKEQDEARRVLLYQKELLKKLQEIEPDGRIAIRFLDLEELEGSRYDLMLEDGDEIYIPPRPGVVTVIGRVFSPRAFLYQPEWSVEDYIKHAGGRTPDADQKRLYLVKANGYTYLLESKRFARLVAYGRYWGETPKIEEGDLIVVPPSLERKGKWWRMARETMQLIYHTAASLGTLKYLFE